MSSTRELDIASRKRPSSPTPSDADNLSDLSESPSDFEDTNKPTRKPVKKKPRTSKAPSPLSKDDPFSNVPKYYLSEEGNTLGRSKWWKEVTKHDEWWNDFWKFTPKNILTKRLLIHCVANLNEEAGKETRSNETVTATASKAKRTTTPRKSAKNFTQSTLSVDALADSGTAGDAPSTSLQVTNEDNTQIKPKDSVMMTHNTDLNETTKQPVQEEAAGSDTTAPKERGGLIADALATRDLTPETRKQYLGILKQQEAATRSMEQDAQAKKREEEARQKRAAAMERKAAKEACMEVEMGDEVVLENAESENKEKPRKIFNPTRF